MHRDAYSQPWEYRELTGEIPGDPHPVVIPHDAVLAMARVPDSRQMASGYFPGVKGEYRTQLLVPARWRDRHVVLEFEAVHRSAVVFVNGDLAARQPSGSTSFSVELDTLLRYGAANEIVVEFRADRDARWYTGGGIIRPVHFAVGPRVHIPLDGVVVTTPEHDAEASLVQVITTVRNLGSVPVVRRLETSILGPAGDVVGVDRTRVSVPAGGETEISQRILVEAPRRWSVDNPELYRATSLLTSGDGDEDLTDRSDVAFGIRSLHLDARRGLRVNGQPVKLRGACVHADNGVIGGATFDGAETRRVAILKSAGFNAIRSAHQPMSRAMLEACDRLGMFVMDELTDVWTMAKSPEDGSDVFLDRWRSDLEAMVRKDRNHPSVIIYSIGNEIPEAVTRSGSELTRAMAAETRTLDPARYVTAAVNGALFVMDGAVDVDPELLGGASLEPVTEINARSMSLEERMSALAVTDAVAELTEEAYGALDIAGMNYQDARYELDHERYPNRVIVGSETFPTRIDQLWDLVLANPHVIGDFTWTGWDYLGEPGLGRMHYRDDQPGGGALGAYPFLLSSAGDIDITGERRPASYYREIVYGMRSEPFIAVRRPHTRGREMKAAPWSWTDSIPSWTWSDTGADPLEVEVYSDADEVELFVAGSSLGRQPAGAAHGFRALFAVPYAPGTLEVVAVRDGVLAQRMALQTAGIDRRLALSAELSDPDAAGHRLAFVVIELVDDLGVRATNGDIEVEVAIDGSGVLQGFGSARPETDESFADSRHRLYDGRALAVVRSTGTGRVVLTASAPGLPSVTVEV